MNQYFMLFFYVFVMNHSADMENNRAKSEANILFSLEGVTV